MPLTLIKPLRLFISILLLSTAVKAEAAAIHGTHSERLFLMTAPATLDDSYKELLPAGVPSPPDFISFNGSVAGVLAQLNWSVLYNETIQAFDVEQSDDGWHFTTALTITPCLHAGVTSYTRLVGYASNTAFFRIKLTHSNDAVTYSPVIRLAQPRSIQADGIELLNQSKKVVLRLLVTVARPGSYCGALYKLSGERVFQWPLTLYNRCSEQCIYLLSPLRSGLYVVQLHNANETVTGKIMIQ